MNTHKGKYKRSNIPHYDAAGVYQMITYRLDDSLPENMKEKLLSERPLTGNELEQLKYRLKIERLLDKGFGSCVLRNPEVAQIVMNAWHFYDQQHYDLIAYTVMPNHVHLLIKEYEEWNLAEVVYSWKSYTSKEILKVLEKYFFSGGPESRTPSFGISDEAKELLVNRKVWQDDYWDRYIRNEEHYYRAINYILNNAVKAKLVADSQNYPFLYFNSSL